LNLENLKIWVFDFFRIWGIWGLKNPNFSGYIGEMNILKLKFFFFQWLQAPLLQGFYGARLPAVLEFNFKAELRVSARPGERDARRRCSTRQAW
jgi:hypothetical protein